MKVLGGSGEKYMGSFDFALARSAQDDSENFSIEMTDEWWAG